MKSDNHYEAAFDTFCKVAKLATVVSKVKDLAKREEKVSKAEVGRLVGWSARYNQPCGDKVFSRRGPSPVITTYSARIDVHIPHLVRCVNCKCRYIYDRHFEGRAEGRLSPEGAEEKAREDLAEMLSHLEICDPVPCPQCFHYQPYMFSQVGYGAYDNLGCVSFLLDSLGILTMIGAAAYAVFVRASGVAAGLAVGGGIAFLIGVRLERRRSQLVKEYNPHEENALARRKHVAGARAILVSDYDARQTTRVNDEFRQHREKAERNSRGEPNPFVAGWYLDPSVFIHGGSFSIALPGQETITLQVPENTEPGHVFDVHSVRDANPFGVRVSKVRVLAMRIHPDEYGVEDETNVKSDNHYEAAFDAYLRERGAAVVPVVEARRSYLDADEVKSPDFIVVGPRDAKLIVDVKGRKFPGSGAGGRPRNVWHNWCELEDVRSLLRWSDKFGDGFRGVLAFVYHLGVAVQMPANVPDLFAFRGRNYLFRGVLAADYRAHMQTRSPRWGTVHLLTEDFRALVKPITSFLAPVPDVVELAT